MKRERSFLRRCAGIPRLAMMLSVLSWSLSACNKSPSDPKVTTSKRIEVPPRVSSNVASLAPIELSKLIFDAMPPEGTEVLDRGGLVNDPIVWIGDESSPTGGARIRINGTTAISYQTNPPKELEWVISVGKNNSSDTLASRTISIPGNLCSNETEKNCTFSSEQAFASPNVKAEALCTIPRDNGSKTYFRLTSPGRETMVASIVNVKNDDKTAISILELALATTALVPCARAGDGVLLEPLTRLLDSCDSTHPDVCGDMIRPVWQKFESETGEVIKLDTASIEPTTYTGSIATIYTYSPGSPFDPTHLRQLFFTCKGQFSEVGGMGNVAQDAPPRSVIGTVATTVCKLADPIRRGMLERNAARGMDLRGLEYHPSSENNEGRSLPSPKREGADSEGDPKPE